MKNYVERLVMLLPVAISGCATYMPFTISTNSVGSPYEHPVGVAQGQSSAYYILGLGPIGDDSLGGAVDDALSYRRASFMTNVFADRRLVCFPWHCHFSSLIGIPPLVTRIDTLVYGTLVSYSGKEYRGGGGVEPEKDVMEMTAKEVLETIVWMDFNQRSKLWSKVPVKTRLLLRTELTLAISEAQWKLTEETKKKKEHKKKNRPERPLLGQTYPVFDDTDLQRWGRRLYRYLVLREQMSLESRD